jgi:hypothetical protein
MKTNFTRVGRFNFLINQWFDETKPDLFFLVFMKTCVSQQFLKPWLTHVRLLELQLLTLERGIQKHRLPQNEMTR